MGNLKQWNVNKGKNIGNSQVLPFKSKIMEYKYCSIDSCLLANINPNPKRIKRPVDDTYYLNTKQIKESNPCPPPFPRNFPKTLSNIGRCFSFPVLLLFLNSATFVRKVQVIC